MATRSIQKPPRAINYPSCDGRPLGESDVHLDVTNDTRLTLGRR